MGKIITFWRYSKDFFKHGEFHYFLSSIKYMLTGKPTRHAAPYTSSLGKFVVRAGTLDFQFANYAYEWGVKKYVYKHVDQYNKFLDVGANIGTYSILFAKKGMEGCAFEPVTTNFEALSKNIALNNLTRQVKLINLALGSHIHTDVFTFVPDNTGASHLKSIKNDDVKDGGETEVKVVTLDSLIDQCGFDPEKDRVFIKIDVEGMEANVLEGAKEFLKSFPEIIIVMESVHSGKEKLSNLLKSIDDRFQILDVDDLNMGAIKTRGQV